jgi:hypothetical protein
MMVSKLNSQEEAELGFIFRAIAELCINLSVPPEFHPVILALVRGPLQTALIRAKPNRRLSHLRQWRHFLCSLPDWLLPTGDRLKVAEKAICQFKLQDQRGKAKPSIPNPEGTNCIMLRDGEPWFAKAPDRDLELPRYQTKATKKWQKKRLLAGNEVHRHAKPASAIDSSEIQYLRPLNQPHVLHKEYKRLCVRLEHKDMNNQKHWPIEFPDVPAQIIDLWLQEGASSSELALLVAAHRAGYRATYGALSTFRAILAFEK